MKNALEYIRQIIACGSYQELSDLLAGDFDPEWSNLQGLIEFFEIELAESMFEAEDAEEIAIGFVALEKAQHLLRISELSL